MSLFQVVVSDEFLGPMKRNTIFIRLNQRIFLREIRKKNLRSRHKYSDY